MLGKHIHRMVLLSVYLDAPCVYDTHNSMESGKSWSFGHSHAIDRYLVLLLVYLDAACVYDTHDTELEKSWSFGHCHAIDRYCGPCMARLSVLSTLGGR